MTPEQRNQERWASAKLRRDFVRWLKIEAAKRGEYMGETVESLVRTALGGKTPWRKGKTA